MKYMSLLPEAEIVHQMLSDEEYSKIQNGKKEFAGLKKGIEIKDAEFVHKNRDVLFKNLSLKIEKDNLCDLRL